MVPCDSRKGVGCASAWEWEESIDHVTTISSTTTVGMHHLSTRHHAIALQTSYQNAEVYREVPEERNFKSRWPSGRAGSRFVAS